MTATLVVVSATSEHPWLLEFRGSSLVISLERSVAEVVTRLQELHPAVVVVDTLSLLDRGFELIGAISEREFDPPITLVATVDNEVEEAMFEYKFRALESLRQVLARNGNLRRAESHTLLQPVHR